MAKIRDLTCLTDILPTGYYGAVSAGVGPGSTVYIAGAGPVGLAAAASSRLLGAAWIIVGDTNSERLAHARSVGFDTIDVTRDVPMAEQIAAILGVPEVDCGIDCVGFEAHGQGSNTGKPEPAVVLNTLMSITRAGGSLGIPGLYVTEDPGALDENARRGSLSLRFGLGWAKSHSFFTGQTPVLRYNRQLMEAVLNDRIRIADVVNVEVITLDDAPQGYKQFDAGIPRKFVIDPHASIPRHGATLSELGAQRDLAAAHA
jgi:glutathione-independent formaldehyde dehydrogenase